MKKLLAILLVAAMCMLLLAACAGSDKPAAPADTGDETETNDTPSTPEETDAPDEDEGYAEENIVEVVYYGFATISNEEHIQAVEDAVNAITESKIGVHMSLNFFDFGNYNTQLNLAISGGEQVDIAVFNPLPGGQLGTLVINTQAMDISGMLEENAPDAYALIEPYMAAFTFGDGIYGMPALRQKATNFYFQWSEDLVNELGVRDTVVNAETWAELEPVYQAILDHTDAYPYGAARYLLGSSYFFFDPVNVSAIPYDSIGDTMYLVYGDENGNASSVFENDAWMDTWRLMADWYDAGYVYPDTPTNLELGGPDMMKNGLIAFGLSSSELGAESTLEGLTGIDCGVRNIGNGMLTSTTMTLWGNFIPSTSAEPEAALRFLNECFINPELMTLMDWGIEGEDYILNENGEACYPEGTDPAALYHQNDWILGNSFIIAPWDGNGANFREEAKADLENSQISPYMGFTFDATGLDNLIGGLASVSAEYRASIEGGLYTDELKDEFVAKLNASGFQDYIDAIQTQLDAWEN